MSFRDINSVKLLQLSLQEAGLYASSIDGIWGGGCRDAASAFFGDCEKALGIKTTSIIKNGGTQMQVIKDLQWILQELKQYAGAIDGLWGNGTKTGLRNLLTGYKQRHGLPNYSAAWSKKVPPEFIQKIEAWVKARGLPAEAVDWLMACMNFESGGTFNPRKQNNGGSNYWGLIQFGDGASKDLGYALEQVKNMSQLQQLDLVFAYFDMWAKRGKRYTQLEDFYLTILYPKAVGMKADDVLWRKELSGKNFSQNSGFDKNNDDCITIGEICTTIYASYFDGMLIKNRRTL